MLIPLWEFERGYGYYKRLPDYYLLIPLWEFLPEEARPEIKYLFLLIPLWEFRGILLDGAARKARLLIPLWEFGDAQAIVVEQAQAAC